MIILLGGGAYTMRRFTESEFREWEDRISPDLLERLDKFAIAWGKPVIISTAKGAIGRHGGVDDTSQHNFDRWGEVRAIDIFPQGLNSSSARSALTMAKSVGFTGIGFYSDTKPSMLMHVDVRTDRVIGDPALWGRVNGKYVSIFEVVK